MDNAIRDALRWFLTKELLAERHVIWNKIGACENFLEISTDADARNETAASLKLYRIMHKELTDMWEALWEQSGEAE